MFDFLRNNCFLIDDMGVKRPVVIESVSMSPYEQTTFHGFFSNLLYEKPIKNDRIKKVIFNDPATIVIWDDGTKTIVKCQPGDTYDKEKGLALCISKKYFGNKGNFNEVFKKWIPEEISLPLGFKYEEDPKHLEPIEVGTRIKIINGGCGAYGANGKTGVVMKANYEPAYWGGLTEKDLGYYVKTDQGHIWKIALNAEIEILKEGK